MADYFTILPPDVFIDVIARLPIKTLVRCTCVSKSWYSSITNANFITIHLNRSNDKELLLVRSYDGEGDNQEHYSLRYDNESFVEYAPELEFPLKSYCNHYFRIIGVCNGLICLSDDPFTYVNDLFLWNPSIRRMMPLPPVRVTFESHGPFTANIGFGFDPITDDYKVVRIVHLECYNYSKPLPTEIDIFTVSTGAWRNISNVGLPHPNIIINERASQAFLNGAVHWIGSYRYHRFFILSFHMGQEEFGQIMLPDYIMAGAIHVLMGSAYYFRVFKFQESLALIQFTGPEENICSIWVMQEYGVRESWFKKFNIDMTGSFNTVAGFTRKGEVLLTTSAGYLVAHDPQAGRLMHLAIRGTTHQYYKYSFYADAYTESLVLLGKRFCDSVTSEESSHGAVERRSGAN